MRIDTFYADIDKSQFYLGLISQVYKNVSVVQVENLSWLYHRKIKNEMLIPNTINFHVVIDSVQGMFLGEVYQSKIPSSDNVHYSLNNGNDTRVYPELNIDIIGLFSPEERKFVLPGFLTVGLTDKVYIANTQVMSEYLNSLEIHDNNGEKLTRFAEFSNKKNIDVSLNAQTLFDRHLLTIGTTNSGKSTSSLSILDKLVMDKKKVLIIDPTGEYENSFNTSEVQKVTLGQDTVIDVGILSFSQWSTLFETNESTQPAVLADAIRSLRFQKKNGQSEVYIKDKQNVDSVDCDMTSLDYTDKSFDINLLGQQILEEGVELDKTMTKYLQTSFQYNQKQWLAQRVEHKLKNTTFCDFFKEATSGQKNLIEVIENFMSEKETSLYINSSQIGQTDEVGSMIIDLICESIMHTKEKNDISFVIFIDEVHRYTKNKDSYLSLSSVAREGRKKGIFLSLTTQNPHDIPSELLGQIGTLLIHRLTHKKELDSIRNHLSENSFKQIIKLNRGEAILTSINLLQDLHIKILKSNREHNNETPLL